MKFRSFFLGICLLMVLMACKQTESDSRSGVTPRIGERMQMAPFRMASLTDNVMLDSGQLKGQVLLVNFFATWCPPCIQEIPAFIALHDAYKAKGFSVVAFSVDEGDPEPLRNLIKKYGINYPVLLANPDITRSFGGVTGIPVTFLVNRKGEVVRKYLGFAEHDVLEEEIKALLAEG